MSRGIVLLGAKRKKIGVKPKATPDAPPALSNTSPPADGEGEARGVTSQALVAEPLEPPKRLESVVVALLPEGQALEGPQSADALMLATSGQPSEPPAPRDDASLTTPPGTALEAPQEETQRTPVYVHGVLNEAFRALGKVAVVMKNGEKEAKAARAGHEEALKEAESARAACEEAMEGAAAAAKHHEDVEARLKALQEEQAKLAEQLCSREEELDARKTKLAAREEKFSQEETRLGAKQARLDELEKEIAATKKKKAAELVDFPDVELRLRTAHDTLCRDGFVEPLATPESGFAMLTTGLAAALEEAVIQVDRILDNECRDLFFEATTRIFSHLHLHEPGFDLNSVIMPVPVKACDRIA
ncbi:hypothetical protein D1007_12273 [Hordeum vulgare]|nr:hypothetical protein D1007_12273 [Hordeum vulgare]